MVEQCRRGVFRVNLLRDSRLKVHEVWHPAVVPGDHVPQNPTEWLTRDRVLRAKGGVIDARTDMRAGDEPLSLKQIVLKRVVILTQVVPEPASRPHAPAPNSDANASAPS